MAVLRTGSVLGLLPSSVVGAAGDENWAPKFLTAQQNETLIALGERIIPGSTQAFCNRLIDFVLPIESEKNRMELLQSLAGFDAEAAQLHSRPFKQLSSPQQDEILTAASEGGKLHAEFRLVKEWMADTYWSSLNGLRELGWTGRMAWESFPDCGSLQPGH